MTRDIFPIGRTRLLPLIAALAMSGAPVSAHDFWLEADRFRPLDSEILTVRFLVGHGEDVGPWDLRPSRVAALRRIDSRGAEDLSGLVTARTVLEGSQIEIEVSAHDTSLIAFESTPTEHVMAADKFIAYAAEEGLTRAIDATERVPKAAYSESYSRRAKAIVFHGAGDSAVVTTPVGHTLEITPLDNMLSTDPGAPLRLQVRFRGAPLEGALLSLDDLSNPSAKSQKAVTDANGESAFSVGRTGKWKANVVWSEPAAPEGKVDFETIFASLTFGFE